MNSLTAANAAMHDVRLWDGQVYDAAALAMRCPLLASYAAEAAAFEELTNSKTSRSRSGRSMRTSADAVVQASCLILVIVTFLGAVGCGAFYVLLDLTSVGLALASLAVHRWSIREQERVSIRDGEIRLSQNGRCVQLPLKECFWYLGAFCHDDKQPLFASKPAICITHRTLLAGDGRGCVALGFSQDTFDVLRQFLDVAGVTRLRDRSSREYWVVAIAAGASVLALHSFAIFFGVLLGYADAEFYLGVLFVPPVAAVAAAYASVFAGNDRWALTEVRGWLIAASIAWFGGLGARFHLGGEYMAVGTASLIVCAAASWDITSPRWPGAAHTLRDRSCPRHPFRGAD